MTSIRTETASGTAHKAVPRTLGDAVVTVVGMPQTDAGGLAESWLFKHCGDQHWKHLCAALGTTGVETEALEDDQGRRLYPTFVAIRARYSVPLAEVILDDRLTTTVDLAHFGQSFFVSTVTLERGGDRFQLELLTTFVARNREDRNDLLRAQPAVGPPWRARSLESPPPLLSLGRAMRHGEVERLELGEHGIDLSADLENGGDPLPEEIHEPSPFSDFNGVGLFYFAAYPTLASTLERRAIHRAGLLSRWLPDRASPDFALHTSTVARDVFYYRNLDLGEKLKARFPRCERRGAHLLLHTRLLDLRDRPLADVLSVRRWTP